MLRKTRRFLVLAITSMLAGANAAQAGFVLNASVLASQVAATATAIPCNPVTPVVHAISLSVPSAGSGAVCTNDTQCTALGESCVFAGGNAMSGTCSASGILSRGDIHYVAGSLIDVEVTIPSCTAVSHVNGVPLGGTTSSGGGDAVPASVSWAFLPSGPATTVNGQPAIRQRLRVTMSNAGDGTTAGLSIQVTARTGGATTTRSVTIGQVTAVNAAMRTTVAERAVRNAYVASIYDQFGDYEQYWNDEGVRVYGVNWSELLTLANDRHAGTDMRIENGRIVFSVQSKAEKPGCNPNVWVEGAFRLVPSSDSVRIEWLKGPEARADTSGVCGPLALGLWDLFTDIFADEEAIAAPFSEKISSGLGAENGLIKVCDACRVVDVKIGDGKVEIWAITPSPRVRVVVRANRGMDVTSNPAQGMIVPGGLIAPIIGAGTLETCVESNGIPGSCDSFVTDIGGAFNWWGSDVPVPASIAYAPDGHAVVLGGRANARDRLKGVLRDTTKLPAKSFAADALIARRTQSGANSAPTRVLAENGCVIPPAASDYRIAIGVNETHLAPPVRGKLEATVLIASDAAQSTALFGSMPACPAEAPEIARSSTSSLTLSRR